jgi:hypothetical protein
VVETGGLENRLRGNSHGGSNPSSSARKSEILPNQTITNASAGLCSEFARERKLGGPWEACGKFKYELFHRGFMDIANAAAEPHH